MTRQESIRFLLLRTLGNFLILFSLYGVYATFGPVISEELKVRIIQARGVQFRVAQVSQVPRVPQGDEASDTTRDTFGRDLGFADVLAGSKDQTLIPKDPQFSILIPKVAASAKVIPNVNPDNPDEYLPVLKQGVAHAKGSVFPGFPGNTYLFAHSAMNWWDAGQYNAVFYTLNNLSEGDDITIFFENKRYDYAVTEKIISDPNDISLITGKHEGDQQLILQTCWPPGTTFKRLYIIAKPKTI